MFIDSEYLLLEADRRFVIFAPLPLNLAL